MRIKVHERNEGLGEGNAGLGHARCRRARARAGAAAAATTAAPVALLGARRCKPRRLRRCLRALPHIATARASKCCLPRNAPSAARSHRRSYRHRLPARVAFGAAGVLGGLLVLWEAAPARASATPSRIPRLGSCHLSHFQALFCLALRISLRGALATLLCVLALFLRIDRRVGVVIVQPAAIVIHPPHLPHDGTAWHHDALVPRRARIAALAQSRAAIVAANDELLQVQVAHAAAGLNEHVAAAAAVASDGPPLQVVDGLEGDDALAARAAHRLDAHAVHKLVALGLVVEAARGGGRGEEREDAPQERGGGGGKTHGKC